MANDNGQVITLTEIQTRPCRTNRLSLIQVDTSTIYLYGVKPGVHQKEFHSNDGEKINSKLDLETTTLPCVTQLISLHHGHVIVFIN